MFDIRKPIKIYETKKFWVLKQENPSELGLHIGRFPKPKARLTRKSALLQAKKKFPNWFSKKSDFTILDYVESLDDINCLHCRKPILKPFLFHRLRERKINRFLKKKDINTGFLCCSCYEGLEENEGKTRVYNMRLLDD